MEDADERTHVLLMPHDLIHREIVGSDDERIGFVKDLLIDEVDWKVRFLHATQGGFLSLDERHHFLIPIEAVRVVAGGFLRVEVDKEKVQGGAEVGPEHPPALRTARRDLRVLRLPEPQIGAEAWASPWRRQASWPSRHRSLLDRLGCSGLRPFS
jgi:sporulation protein YlmC with PRC-barrel domain